MIPRSKRGLLQGSLKENQTQTLKVSFPKRKLSFLSSLRSFFLERQRPCEALSEFLFPSHQIGSNKEEKEEKERVVKGRRGGGVKGKGGVEGAEGEGEVEMVEEENEINFILGKKKRKLDCCQNQARGFLCASKRNPTQTFRRRIAGENPLTLPGWLYSSRPTLSQLWSLIKRESRNFMLFGNVDRRISRL